MEEYALILQLGIPILLIVLGFVAGKVAESRHYRRIGIGERAFLDLPAITSQDPMEEGREVAEAKLVIGSVVVSVDYFKRFLAALRMFFGGELGAYASLIDRGKREALLRMKQSWPEADVIVNVRLQTASLSHGEKKTLGSVEVVAYGTAVKYAPEQEYSF